MIQERISALDAVRHRDAVALRRQYVTGQQQIGLEVFSLMEMV
jgi:hypothetical protein